MADTTEPRVIPIEAIGHTARVVQRNALAISGIYRAYISQGEQVEQAAISVVDGLAECFTAGGRPAVDACMAIVRRRLIDTGVNPTLVTAWTTELATATSAW